MKTLNRKTAVWLAALLCAGTLGTGTVALSAARAEDGSGTAPDLSESYLIGDLPYHTHYSNFGYYDAGYVKYVMKAGRFAASAAEYGLTAFDTKASDNKITLTTKPGLEIENWRWTFAANTSVVIEIQSAITGTILFDYSSVQLGGWMDAWNTIYTVHRKNAETGTLDTLVNYSQGRDSVSGATLTDAGSTSGATYTISVDVKAGDTIYYEVGSTAGRNLQEVTNAKIVANPTEIGEAVVSSYAKKLDAQVAALTKENYAESDWALIEGYVSTFKAGTYETAEALYTAYTTAKTGIEAVQPDPLKDKRTELLNSIGEFYNGLDKNNYTAENWTLVETAYNEFVTGAEACETETELQSLYDEKYAAMDAVKAYKQDFAYLDYPSKMNANGYDWIEGDVFDTKLYAGGVESGLKEFDSKGASENIIYNAELNAGLGEGKYAYYAENWKWYIGRDAGIIVAYTAKADCKIEITNTRIASGSGNNGWTSDCVLTGYILRGEDVKKISSVNAPASDEDFSGTYYLKEGDVLYIEFASFTINAGDVRNTEAPYGMKAAGDSTAFDEAAYAEQNHDLPAEVTAAIEEKTQALNEYYAGLKEADYSATNWLTLSDYIAQFVSKCETEVDTVEDVTALYESIFAEMQAVPTLAQAEAELKETLEGYVAELQAEYDRLIKENEYTAENKAALDQALADGIAQIRAAKSKAAGNTARREAITALGAIEKKTSAETGGCGSALGVAGLLTGLSALLVGAAVLGRKKH